MKQHPISELVLIPLLNLYLTLLDLIVNNGESAIKKLPESIKNNENAVSEVIENNVRRLIIDEKPTNPKYYDKMSILLNDLIRQRKNEAINYKKYLKKIVEFVKKLKNPKETTDYPTDLDTASKRALYDNLGDHKDGALVLHDNIIEYKPDGWRGNKIKEKNRAS